MAVLSAGRSSSPPPKLAGLGCGCWAQREASCPWETEGCRPAPCNWTLACGHCVDPCERPAPEEKQDLGQIEGLLRSMQGKRIEEIWIKSSWPEKKHYTV